KLLTMCTSWARTHSLCRTARSSRSHLLPRARQRPENIKSPLNFLWGIKRDFVATEYPRVAATPYSISFLGRFVRTCALALQPRGLIGMQRRMRSLLRTAFPLTLISLALLATCRAAEKAERPGWKLTFQDEFDGNALNTNKWNPKDPWERERNRE